MKAVVFDHTGPPETVLRIADVPTPSPARGEVLVRMTASPINPSDLLYIAGQYGLKPPAYPATPGFEGVGVVEASGGGLLGRFYRGKRVAVLGSRTGGWAEFAVAKAKQVIPVPADIPDEQAAGFFVNPATALVLARHVLRVPKGEWLLQSAAGSSLGKMLVRLGRHDGFRTVNVVRRREQVEELTRLGADRVLVESDGPISDQVRAVVPGGVTFALDPVGGGTGTEVVKALGAGGRAVLYGLLSGEPIALDPRFLITGGKRVEGFWLGDFMQALPLLKKLRLVREVRRLIRAGVLTTDVGAAFPLDRVGDAVRAASAPGKGGKVLLRVAAGG